MCGVERRTYERVAHVALNGSLWIWRKFMEAGQTVSVEIDWVVGFSALKGVVNEYGRNMERNVYGC